MVAQQVHPITQPVAREHESATASQRLSGVLDGCRIVLGLEKQRRRLATVLYADVVDYTRLTEEDEEGTHNRLIKYLDLLTSKIRSHGGHVAHYAGDAVLAEFGDVVSSVRCAVSVQELFAKLNSGLPVNRRVRFRIGLNMGEVICHRGDVYGNVVNIAARLEGLAEPGGIVVSEFVRDNLGNHLAVACKSLGEQWIKNISVPVRAHRLAFQSGSKYAKDSDNVVPLELLRQQLD